MKSELSCPVCGSDLIYHQVGDAVSKVFIRKNDKKMIESETIDCSNDGSVTVYCSKDDSHKIPYKLQNTIISIAEDFGY